MLPQETYVQVAPDGSGKKIRNLQVVTVLPDGSEATVFMQVVQVIGEDGFPVSFDQGDQHRELIDRLDRLIDLVEAIMDFRGPQKLATDRYGK